MSTLLWGPPHHPDGLVVGGWQRQSGRSREGKVFPPCSMRLKNRVSMCLSSLGLPLWKCF